MPHIETPDEIAEQVADWIGLYGGCKSDGDDGCDEKNPFCCRQGFVMDLTERIRTSVENEQKIESLNLTSKPD